MIVNRERWKHLPGDWGHFYMVSNYGNVKALARTVNGWKRPVTRKETLIKPTIHKRSGTLCFRAWTSGEYKVFFIHRIVALLFVKNKNKKTHKIVAFKDGDVVNCNAKNLYWTTHGETVKNGKNAGKIEKEKIKA